MDTNVYKCSICGWEGIPDGVIEQNSRNIIMLPFYLGVAASVLMCLITKNAIVALLGCTFGAYLVAEVLCFPN